MNPAGARARRIRQPGQKGPIEPTLRVELARRPLTALTPASCAEKRSRVLKARCRARKSARARRERASCASVCVSLCLQKLASRPGHCLPHVGVDRTDGQHQPVRHLLRQGRIRRRVPDVYDVGAGERLDLQVSKQPIDRSLAGIDRTTAFEVPGYVGMVSRRLGVTIARPHGISDSGAVVSRTPVAITSIRTVSPAAVSATATSRS